MADDPEKLKNPDPKEASATTQEAPSNIGYVYERFSPSEPRDDVAKEREKIKNRTAIILLGLAAHTLILGLTLGSIYLIHLILEGLFGHDAKFFNSIPVSWIIDVADLLVIGKFLWEVIKGFREAE